MLRDLLFYVPSKLIPAALGFLLVVILTHSLTPEEYGQYAAILAIVNLSDALVSAWLRQSILRFYPQYQTRGESDVFQDGALLLVVLATGCVAVLVAAGMGLFGYSILQIVIALAVSFAQILFIYLTTLYQSSRLSAFYAVVTLFQSFAQVIWIAIFVWWTDGGYLLAVSAVLAGYAVGIVSIYLVRSRTGIRFVLNLRRFDLSLLKRLMRYGLPMSFFLLSFQFLSLANRLIIASLRSYEEAGIYSSSYDLINGSMSMIMTPFLLASHPLIMQLWSRSHDRNQIETLISRVVRYVVMICAPIFAWSIVLDGNVLRVVLGSGFGVEKWVISLMIAAAFVGQLSMYFHKGLEIAEKTTTMLVVALATIGVNLVLNVLLISRYGYPAAAASSLVSYLFYVAVVYRFSGKYIRMVVSWGSMGRIATACVVACLCYVGIRYAGESYALSGVYTAVLSTIAFALSYGVTLYATRELVAEKQQLGHWVHRFQSSQTR